MGEKTQKVKRAFSAGGIVFKEEKGENLFLIIKPAGFDRWQLPKGLIDEGETSKDTAVREVEEEGGVEAEILDKLGISSYFFVWEGKRIFKSVTYFLMKYIKDTGKNHDEEVDEVLFVPFKEAYEKLTYKDDKNILEKAKEKIKQGIQENLV